MAESCREVKKSVNANIQITSRGGGKIPTEIQVEGAIAREEKDHTGQNTGHTSKGEHKIYSYAYAGYGTKKKDVQVFISTLDIKAMATLLKTYG